MANALHECTRSKFDQTRDLIHFDSPRGDTISTEHVLSHINYFLRFASTHTLR